ncbi:MAG: hypothetical protein ABIQ88_02415 [Chitinophagaceae bacterium]
MAETNAVLKITDNTAGLYYKIAPGAVVDNVFSFLDQDGVKIKIVENKGRYTARMGGILPGGNMLAKLQAVFSHADVKEVVLDEGDITLTGTLNCGGKKIVFINGSKITGTNIINGAVIDCSLFNQCFTVGTTLTNCRSVRTEFSTENFGADGNDGTDQTQILQKTSDTLVSNANMPKNLKMFRNRVYRTQGWIFHNWDGANYGQYSLAIIGEKSAFGGNPGFHPRIKGYNLDGFTVNIQRATGFTMEGVEVSGPLNIPDKTTWSEFYARPYSTFSSAYGGRDSRYTPSCVVGIDLFSNTNYIPPDGGYPGYTADGASAKNPSNLNWYRGDGSGNSAGSTGVRLADLVVSGATVGILVSPNGQSQQAENLVFTDVYGSNCKAIFAFCQAESKDCFIYRGYAISRVHTILDTVSWGVQQGTPPYVRGFNSSGSVVQFINGASRHVVSFEDLYLENLFRVGNFSASGDRGGFKNCKFSFNADTTYGNLAMPATHMKGDNVYFEKSTLKYYDDLFNKRIVIEGTGNTFDNCGWDLPPITTTGFDFAGSPKGVYADFRDCYYGENGVLLFGFQSYKGQNVYNPTIAYKSMTVEGQYENIYGTGYGKFTAKYECGDFQRTDTNLEGNGVYTTYADHTGVFYPYGEIAPNNSYILIPNPAGGATFVVLGRVVSQGAGFCNLADVPLGIPVTASTSTLYAVATIKYIKYRFTGKYTYGSNIITNIFGYVSPGERDVYTGYHILSFDLSTRTAVMLGNCNFYATEDLYTPPVDLDWFHQVTYTRFCNPTDSFLSGESRDYYPGDIWITYPRIYGLYSNTNTLRKFKCIQSGFNFPGAIGQTKQALWEEIFDGEFKQLKVGTADMYAVIPKGRFIRGWKLLATGAGMTVTAGTADTGTDIDAGTVLTAGVSAIVESAIYADTDTVVYFNGITGTGGTLTINFF